MFEGFDELGKYGIIVLVLGASFLKWLYQALKKPAPQARPGPGPQGGNKPAVNLQEFLEQVRRQASGEAAKPAAAPEVPAQEEEVAWQTVETPETPEPQAEPVGPPARVDEAQQRRQAAQAHQRRRDRTRQENQEQRGADKRDRSEEPTPVAAEGQDTGTHDFFEKLAESGAQAQVPSARSWGGREGSRSVASSRGVADHDVRTFPLLPVVGCSLRDAVIAQVILSPPRCRQRSYRRQ